MLKYYSELKLFVNLVELLLILDHLMFPFPLYFLALKKPLLEDMKKVLVTSPCILHRSPASINFDRSLSLPVLAFFKNT